MKFALLALLGLAAAEETVETEEECDPEAEDCEAAEEEGEEGEEADAEPCEGEDCEEPACEGEECDAGEGNPGLIIVLVVAALGGVGGAVYCKMNNKACFAPKEAAEGG